MPTASSNRLFDAQAHGLNRFSKLVHDLIALYYSPVSGACKQYNFEILLEDIRPVTDFNGNPEQEDGFLSLESILNKTAVPANRIGELLHLSAYLRTAKCSAADNEINGDNFAEAKETQQTEMPSPSDCPDVETLQYLVSLLQANLVQSAVFLKDMQYDRQLRELLQRLPAKPQKVVDPGSDDADEADIPIIVPLNKAITIAAVLANICYYLTNRGLDRIYVSNVCNSGLLFLKRYAIHALTIFSNHASQINLKSTARDIVRDIEVRVADCFINIGRMFANAPPGSLSDQVAYSALTTCMQLFKLQPAVFDSYWGDTMLTSAVNVTPLLLPHMHRNEAPACENDADTGYQEDVVLFFELTNAVIHSPMAVSSSRAALYSVSSECKIHFTTAMFLVSSHSVYAPHTNIDALDAAELEDDFSTSRYSRVCDQQAALLKCHDFAYTFLRNLFDKLSLSKTKKASNDEDVSFEVFQCFCDDLLNCLGEPMFPLVPKLLTLVFRILQAKLEINRKAVSKINGVPGSTAIADKHALVLDLLTNLIIRVKTFSCGMKKCDAPLSDLPLSQQFTAAASAEKLDTEIADFINTNQIFLMSAVDDVCSLAVNDKRSQQSTEIADLKKVALQTISEPMMPGSLQIGQIVLLQLFVTHQMLKKCQADSSMFAFVQVLHSTCHKYERSIETDAEDEQNICARAREIPSGVFNKSLSKKRSFRRSRSRKSDLIAMETDKLEADVETGEDDAAENGTASALKLARYQLHNHLVTLNVLSQIAKQVRIQWGGGQIFSSTKGADEDLLNAAYRLLLLKQNFLHERIIARIRPLVLWALKSGSALAASKVTRCLSTLIEVDASMAHDKQLLRALKSQMLNSSPSVKSACLDCIHNIMLSARTYTSLSRNLPIILSHLTDTSKSVRRKSMKMIAQLIENADLRRLLVIGNGAEDGKESSKKFTLCCKTAAWLILAVNGECLSANDNGISDFAVLKSVADGLEAEDVMMRELATTALSQLLLHVLLAMPTGVDAHAVSKSDFRDIVGQRQVEFFITLMKILHDIGASLLSNSSGGLLATTDYGNGGDSSSTQDTKYTPYARKVGSALRTVLEHNIPVTADMQSLIYSATNNRRRGMFVGGDSASNVSRRRISDNLLFVFRSLAQYAVAEMQEQISRLLRLRDREADNNIPIDEQLELITQFIGQLIEMRPALFAGAMIDKLVQSLHQLVWNIQYQRSNIIQPEDNWRYRTLRSLGYVITRLARCSVIDAAKCAPAVITPGNADIGGGVVGDIINEGTAESRPSSAATLTGLIRKCIRWFLFNHSYIEPFTCDRFVECWIAVADLERRNFVVATQNNLRRHPSQPSSQPQQDEADFLHGRGYADIRGQFERLFNLMRTNCDDLLRTTASPTAGDAAAGSQQWIVQRKKLMAYLQIAAYIWRHLPSLAMLELPEDTYDEPVRQYILRILLLCFQFSTSQSGISPATTGSSSAVFKRALVRLTPQNFRALDSTLRCVGLFAVHYPEILQHPLLAGQYLRDVLELTVPPAPPASAANVQRQQYNLTARWLYQLKFRIVRIYLQIMDHAFPAFAAAPSLTTAVSATKPVDNEYDDITDVEQRDVNSQSVRTERIVTQIMQDRIGQFMQCGSNGSTLLRCECFLLVQKVFRCRLMLPDRYIPFIIALTCDNSPTIVDAATSLLFDVETRYPTFLARAALQGVDHAFRHRCKILTERALAVRAAVDFSASANVVVHGFVSVSEEQAAWSTSDSAVESNEERRSLLSHLVRVIHAASPSPRQALFSWFRNLISRFGDNSVEAEITDCAKVVAKEQLTDVSSAHYDLDERLQWQLFIAGALIYLPYSSHDELTCLLKAVNDRLHPYGAEHFDNLLSSLITTSGENSTICLQGEQVVKLLDNLFTPALLATIKLQLIKMYDIDERTLLNDAESNADANARKHQLPNGTKDSSTSSTSLSVLKPVTRLSFERTKVVMNLALIIPMLRQQKVALQMQYRRHHEGSFRIGWKLELNAEQLHVLIEPLKNAVMRAWGDYDENDTEIAGRVANGAEPNHADENFQINGADNAASISSPASSRKQPARKPTSSAGKHKSRLNAVRKTADKASPTRTTTPKRPRHRRKSCESSSSDDDACVVSSNDDDSNDSVRSRRSKAVKKNTAAKRRRIDDDDDDDFCPGSTSSTPVKSAVSKVSSLSKERSASNDGKMPEKELPQSPLSRGRNRPTRQSATVALQKMLQIPKDSKEV